MLVCDYVIYYPAILPLINIISAVLTIRFMSNIVDLIFTLLSLEAKVVRYDK